MKLKLKLLYYDENLVMHAIQEKCLYRKFVFTSDPWLF